MGAMNGKLMTVTSTGERKRTKVDRDTQMSSTAPVTFISNKMKILKRYRKTPTLGVDERFMIVRFIVYSLYGFFENF